MSLFRSEGHLAAWLARSNQRRGEVLSLTKVFELAKAWYSDPRDPAWRPRTREESQEVLDSVGLTGDFWELPS